jgi:hypothetical protein
MINKVDVFPQQKPANVLTKHRSLDVTKIYNRFRVNVLIKVAFYKAVKFMNQLTDYRLSKIHSGLWSITDGTTANYFQIKS